MFLAAANREPLTVILRERSIMFSDDEYRIYKVACCFPTFLFTLIFLYVFFRERFKRR